MLEFWQSLGPLHIFQLCINWPGMTSLKRAIKLCTGYNKVLMLFYVLGDLWLCWTQLNKSDDGLGFCCSLCEWPRVFPSNFLSHPFLSQWWCTQPLCKVGSLLIMLHEMWLQRFFPVADWLTSPRPVFSLHRMNEGESLQSISRHVFVCDLCCQLSWHSKN